MSTILHNNSVKHRPIHFYYFLRVLFGNDLIILAVDEYGWNFGLDVGLT